MRRLLKIAVLLVAMLALARVAIPPVTQPRAPLAGRDGASLGEVENWGYQLQRVFPALIPAGVDLLVTDYSRDGSASGAWTAAEVARLKRRPDGKPRIVLAYLSIGEAEKYRHYWRSHWAVAPPSWLGQENPEWKGNYAVRFWQPGWQEILFANEPSALRMLAERFLPGLVQPPYLDLIVEAGFDGVYLDKVDGFEDWTSERPSAAADMIELVSRIAHYARARKPGFLIVPQNGEDLLFRPGYVDVIDGIAKEDLLYGATTHGTPNTAEEIEAAVSALRRATAAGLPVLQVEYVADPAKRAHAQREAARLGHRLLFAWRELNLPPELVEPTPPAQVPHSSRPVAADAVDGAGPAPADPEEAPAASLPGRTH